MNLYEILKDRELLYQCTNEEKLKQALESGKPITLYEGTDPTANSLHIGHCVPYCIMRRFQKAGHKVLLLMGGATACIGDPTGRSEIRKVLSKEEIENNIQAIKKSLSVFLDFEGENPAIIVNNADWFKNYPYTDFMREVGVHFNVNKMLSNEIYKNRIDEGGLTFFEMGYMLMQAYDFIHLNREYGCTLQYGGADQWGNIVAGVELQRKLNFQNGTDIELIGATNPLLLTPEGKKMGKTERGAIWIDKDKISPYDFYQGIYQTPDECVRMMFALFTDLPMAEVREIINKDIVLAKKRLAYEITKFIRGEEDAIEAQKMSENLFTSSSINKDNAPTHIYKLEETGANVLDILLDAKFIQSKGEGRRLMQQNGISLDGEIINDFNLQISKEQLQNGVLFKKGKKNFILIKCE